MLESGRGALLMPSVDARGFAIVPVAQATLTSAKINKKRATREIDNFAVFLQYMLTENNATLTRVSLKT